jgi:hypothetical protein
LQLAFEPSYKAFTLKYFAAFLIDRGDAAAAVQLLEKGLPFPLEAMQSFRLKYYGVKPASGILRFL